MKNTLISYLFFITALPCSAATTLSEGFEGVDNTSDWGSSWTGGGVVVTPSFLSSTFGGTHAGSGNSDTSQQYSREFKDNNVGLDEKTMSYSIDLYVQLSVFNATSSGQFQIVNGEEGSNNAGFFAIRSEDTGGGNFIFHWQASNNNVLQDLGINMELNTPYHVRFDVDPVAKTYTGSVQQVTEDGDAVGPAGVGTGLAMDANAVFNGGTGKLLFYSQGSSGAVNFQVDNINIAAVPEPSAALLAAAGILAGVTRRRRPVVKAG